MHRLFSLKSATEAQRKPKSATEAQRHRENQKIEFWCPLCLRVSVAVFKLKFLLFSAPLRLCGRIAFLCVSAAAFGTVLAPAVRNFGLPFNR